MKFIILLVLLSACATSHKQNRCLSPENETLLNEFYDVSHKLGPKVWKTWNQAPEGLLLIEDDTEFLVKHTKVSEDFKLACETPKLGKIYSRKRSFPKNLLASFPAVGRLPTIVIGTVENTPVKSPTEWLSLAMHERFHQIQTSQPGYYKATNKINTSGDRSGKWMLNYPFPYTDAKANLIVEKMKNLLLKIQTKPNKSSLKKYNAYLKELKNEVGEGSYNYFRFQVWQEGMAQYFEYKALEVLNGYNFSSKFKSLGLYESPAKLLARKKISFEAGLKETMKIRKRTIIYSIGLYEGLALDRLGVKWRRRYFAKPLVLDLKY